MKLLVI